MSHTVFRSGWIEVDLPVRCQFLFVELLRCIVYYAFEVVEVVSLPGILAAAAAAAAVSVEAVVGAAEVAFSAVAIREAFVKATRALFLV